MDCKLEYVYSERPETENVVEGDIIKAVSYNHSGDHIALGTRAGHVLILERSKMGGAGAAKKIPDVLDYQLFYKYQSHKPEFDYLKSAEIEEKINQIRWLKPVNSAHMMLTTNDKTIKLWKVQTNKPKHQRAQLNAAAGSTWAGPRADSGVPPPTEGVQVLTRSQARHVYANAHAYHINSISLNADGETFLSADDLRINLWHLDHQEFLNIVDIKPANMDDLSEVVTGACFHPTNCGQFIYSTSKGIIKMGDLRESLNVRSYTKTFDMDEDALNKTFFSEIIASISDLKFSNDGRYILARDYLTLKIWDMAMERRPLRVIPLHEPLKSRLCDLYENEYIFDRFECAWAHSGKYCVTGSYKNQFKLVDLSTGASPTSPAKKPPSVLTFEANRQARKGKTRALMRGLKSKKTDETYEQKDFNRKILYLAVHPNDREVAVVGMSSLFVFSVDGK